MSGEKKKLLRAVLLATAVTWLVAPTSQAAEIEGVEFAERYERQGMRLRLHGLGLLCYRVLIKGYVAALYLGEQVAPERVLDDVPRRLEIEYFWAIRAEAFSRAMLEGIRGNVDAETLRRLRDPIQRFSALYEDVEPGDRYALTNIPGVGTELALNGEPVGLVEGEDFSAALFSIWVGEQALDAALRERLLAAG